MIGDDDANGSATPDPWDEIVADSLDAESSGVAFDFEEAAGGAKPGVEPAPEPGLPAPGEVFDEPLDDTAHAPVEPLDAVGPEAEAGELDEEALVEEWLSEDDGAAESPALSVYPADEAATGASGIDVGTEPSGLGLHDPFDDDQLGAEAFAATPPGESEAIAWPGVESADGEAAEAAVVGFPEEAAAVSAAVVAAVPTGKAARPAKKKSGGLGQLVGVVLGGLMAIPITLAILIYGLGKDPFGITKRVPAEVAFLLPEKFRPGFRAPVAIVDAQPDAAPSLDDVPVVADQQIDAGPVADEPVDAGPVDAAPSVEPAVVTDETAMPAEPAGVPDAGLTAMPPESAPAADPVSLAEPEADEMPVDVPSLDALAASAVPAIPVEPIVEPVPLDTSALDEAVGEASALSAALGVVDDRGNRGYRLLRTRWYRALARMAEELVAVENAALTSGRPLAAAPDSVVELHGVIEASEPLVAELAALAPDWLAYAKRGSDGVVLPATFESVRKVGPLWAARVALTGVDGAPTDLTVISRNEPTAASGERVVVTGVAVGETVIWAADIRGAGTVRVDADATDAFAPSSGF